MSDLLFMPQDKIDAIQKVVDDLIRPNARRPNWPDLELSKPNLHDSKAEFDLENRAVRAAIDGARNVLQALYPVKQNTDEETRRMVTRLNEVIDLSARRSAPKDPPDSMRELLRRNAASTGFYMNAVWILLDLLERLHERGGELEYQRREYWNLKHRHPNHYARTIALRLARLYARETGLRPTIGVARDGNYPSTDFGRALDRVFGELGIVGGFRRPGKWAIDQLEPGDFEPTLGMMLGSPTPGQDEAKETSESMRRIVEVLAKAGKPKT